jgi:hypothetical protein
LIITNEAYFLKYSRIPLKDYYEVRRLTIPRFAVLWKDGKLLPPPDVALVCVSLVFFVVSSSKLVAVQCS